MFHHVVGRIPADTGRLTTTPIYIFFQKVRQEPPYGRADPVWGGVCWCGRKPEHLEETHKDAAGGGAAFTQPGAASPGLLLAA